MGRAHRGVLTARECLTLARPLLRGSSAFLPAVSRWCSECTRGGRSSIDPASLVPPDSLSQRMPGSPRRTCRHRHSSTIPVVPTRGARPSPHFTGPRSTVSCCTWRQCSTTPGSRARCPTSTSRCAAPRWHASSPTATAWLPISASLLQTRSPCITPPALASNPVPRPTSSAGAAVDVFGLQQRDTRCSPPERHPGVPAVGLQAGVRRASPSRGQASPSWPRLVPAPLRHERPKHSARALPWLM